MRISFYAQKWDSMESVRANAGSNPTVAVTYSEDDKYGLTYQFTNNSFVSLQYAPTIVQVRICNIGLYKNKDEFFNKGFEKATTTIQRDSVKLS